MSPAADPESPRRASPSRIAALMDDASRRAAGLRPAPHVAPPAPPSAPLPAPEKQERRVLANDASPRASGLRPAPHVAPPAPLPASEKQERRVLADREPETVAAPGVGSTMKLASYSDGAGWSFPWARLAFGYRVLSGGDAGKVTIRSGALRWYGPDGFDEWSSAATTVKIESGGSTVWAVLDLDALSGTALTVLADAALPSPLGNRIKFPLFRFGRTGDAVTLETIHRMGDIEILPMLSR